MAEKSPTVYILRQASLIISERPNLEEVSEKRQKQIVDLITQFGKIPYITKIIDELHLDDVDAIIKNFPLSSVQDCIDIYEREDQERVAQETAPVKEAVSIPPELEALVAEYEEYLAEKNVNDGKVKTVAESVRRAREAMIIRERLAAIRRNRAALSKDPETFYAEEDKRYEDLIVKLINPKAGDADSILSPATTVIAQAVTSYINEYISKHPDLTLDQQEHLKNLSPSVVDTTRYLSLTEAIDISNHNDLITAISVSLFKADNQFTSSISDIYAELDANAAKHDVLNKEISQHQLQLSKLKTDLNTASVQVKSKEELTQLLSQYSSQTSPIEASIAQKTHERDNITIDLTPFTARVEDYLVATTPIVIAGVKKPDGITTNLDFDTQTAAARKLIDDIQTKLSSSGIQPRIPPPEDPLRQAVDLEKSIRAELPQLGINLHATNEGQQASILISDPKTQSKDLSGQTILLFSKGLTTKELDTVIAHASAHRDDPNSALGKLYKANPDLFGTIRQQLDTIEKTDTPEAHVERVRTFVHEPDNVGSSLNVLSRNKEAFNQYLDLTKKLNGKEIVKYAKSHPDSAIGKFYKSNTKTFGKINSEFEKVKKSALAREIKKPIGRVTRSINSVKNKVSTNLSKVSGFFSRHQSTVNAILNPVGALRSYFGRQAMQFIAKRIIPKIGNATLRKGAEMLLKDGLKTAVKNLAKQAAKRIATEVTKLAAKIGIKAGLQVAAQAANVVPGLGIVIAIAIEVLWAVAEITIGMIKKGLNWLSQNLYGEEFNAKTATRDVALGAGALFGAAATAFVGFMVVASSIAATAVASALGTIILASLTGYFFYITSILAGPIVSTLAQLEATQKSSIVGTCSGETMMNDKLTCRQSGGLDYCFPVNDISTVSYVTAHHDYSANDIMRIGDQQGPGDDVPLPLIAYVDGTVVWTAENDGLGGYAFIIAGIDGRYYYYSHNMCNLVTTGQLVKAGDVVGGMDSSGNAISTYEHVHFQISDQADMRTIPENYPHFIQPWADFCEKLHMCGPLNIDQYPEFN